MTKYITYRFAILYCSLFIVHCSFAQNLSLAAQNKAQARYEIDAKRKGVSPTDKDALPRSREFIRLDSTYYVGYMFEGMYKFDRSADYLGYKNAIIPLQKAFDLMDKDYNKMFHGIYNNVNNLIQGFPKYQDLYMIFTAFQRYHSNLLMP